MFTLSQLRDAVIAIVRENGLRTLDAPVKLASGALSRDYIDGKRAFASGTDLSTACDALAELIRDEGVAFDALGGLTLGADAFAHGVAIRTGCMWFVVRKQVKDHGTKKRVEGAVLGEGVTVVLVEDVVTSGASMVDALDAVQQTGATVRLAVALVDRGELAGPLFAERAVPYRAVITYQDLGIAPVGGGQEGAQATG